MTRPTDTTGWSAPVADVTAPTTAKKNAGWQSERPSRKVFNWFWNLVSTTLTWLLTGQAYSTLPAMIGDTADGDTAPVTQHATSWEHYASTILFSGAEDGFIGGIISNGQYLAFMAIRTLPSAQTTIGCINIETGVIIWNASHFTAPGGGFAFDGNFIYFADNAGNIEVIDNDTSVATTVYTTLGTFATFSTRNATLIAVNGDVMVTVEDDGATGTVERYTSVRSATGTHTHQFATNIGSPNNDVKDLAIGGNKRAYLAKNLGVPSDDNLVVLDLDDLTLVSRIKTDANDGNSVVIDDEHIYFASDGTLVYEIDPETAFTPVVILNADVGTKGLALDDRFVGVVGTTTISLAARKGHLVDSMSWGTTWTPFGVHAQSMNRVSLDCGVLALGGWREAATFISIKLYRLPQRTHSFARVEGDEMRTYPSLLVVP